MIGTTPINNHPKKACEISVKLKKTHLESKKNEELQKFSARRMLGEDGGKDEEKNREGRRRLQNFFLLLSSYWLI